MKYRIVVTNDNCKKSLIIQVNKDVTKWLNNWNWLAQKDSNGNICIKGTRKGAVLYTVAQNLSHLILGLTDPSLKVIHKNRDTLNYLRSNLKLDKKSKIYMHQRRKRKNASSQFNGVYLYRASKWRAQLQIDNEHIYLGTYPDEISAAEAYDKAAVKYFGKYANLNFPEDYNSHLKELCRTKHIPFIKEEQRLIL